MKIVNWSCTHGHHADVEMPNGDMFIFSGDVMKWNSGEAQQAIKFNEWLGKLPYRHILFCPGNHDKFFEVNYSLAKHYLTNAICLNDSGVEIEGLKIWGSPITPTFLNWAFMRSRGPAIDRHWQMIPDDTNILITHGPPSKIMDLCPPWGGNPAENAGCEDLLRRIKELKELKLHTFGHIHEQYGQETHGGVIYVNSCKGYDPIKNPPIVVEI